jgi:hypothetical protein
MPYQSASAPVQVVPPQFLSQSLLHHSQ